MGILKIYSGRSLREFVGFNKYFVHLDKTATVRKGRLKSLSGKKYFAVTAGFTLIEILIVITIIAILASTIIPNFVGFDAEARITATKSNLESMRTRINLFRAKEGRYPDSLGELTSVYYYDVGVKKPYLNKMPQELVSDPKGNNSFIDQTSEENANGMGGWLYLKDTAEIKINFTGPLGKKWGNYSDEEPLEW